MHVVVMARKHPQKVADLMDYMVQIVQASRQFRGTPRAKYDTVLHLQAATIKWEGLSAVDTTLLAIPFTWAEEKEAYTCKWCDLYKHY